MSLANALGRQRRERGLSQAELASAAGTSRQALSAVESGRAVPSTLLALRLARALECSVEELFWLEESSLVQVALPIDRAVCGRARVGWVGGRWVAHPLDADALSDVADAEIVEADGETGRARFFDDPRTLKDRVLVAGCDPALGLLAGVAQRARVEMAWIPQTSGRALLAIDRGEVHAAGAHLYDRESGEHNVPFVRRTVRRACSIFEIAKSDEGLALAPGNPQAIRGVRDLARPDVRIVNRPEGAAARELLDGELALAGVPRASVRGYDRAVLTHDAVVRAITSGSADAGITTRAFAQAHGLDFMLLDRVRNGPARIDLVVPDELLALPAIARLIALTSSAAFKRGLGALGGYDTAETGRLVART